MKNINGLNIATVLLMCLALMGCDYTTQNNQDKGDSVHLLQENHPKAELPPTFFTTENIGASISVLEAKKRNRIGMPLVVEGIIGGQKKPFASNRASFILGDLSLKTCDQYEDDSCPTPWDACCEDRKKLLDATMNIQVLDRNGSLIHGTLNGVGGLRPGLKIKVKGKVSSISLPEAMVVNADIVKKL